MKIISWRKINSESLEKIEENASHLYPIYGGLGYGGVCRKKGIDVDVYHLFAIKLCLTFA